MEDQDFKILESTEVENQNLYKQKKNDKGNIGWAFLGFFVPIVGLILFLVWREERPGDSKMAGIGALISVILEFISGLLYGIILAPYFEILLEKIIEVLSSHL